MPYGTTDSLNLVWVVTIGTGITLALALAFVLILLYHERTKRKLERESERKMMELQEEDRLRISRELHDEIGQTLTAIHINLELIKRDIPPPQAELLSRLDESQSLASDVTRRIRRVIRELRPVDIVDHGLIPSLTKYIAEFEARSGIRIIFRYDPLEEDLSLNEKVTIYRIIQESLTNIARHSGANEAKISLLERENMCMNNGAGEADFITSLEITDNGRGIEATGSKVPGTRATTETPDAHAEGEEWKESGGIGLTGIRERVKLLSGTFQISSSPQHGTRISVTLPRREA